MSKRETTITGAEGIIYERGGGGRNSATRLGGMGTPELRLDQLRDKNGNINDRQIKARYGPHQTAIYYNMRECYLNKMTV